MPAQRPCLDCPRLTPTGNRCPPCHTAHQRTHTRAKRTRRWRSGAEERRRAAFLTQWRTQHGNLCIGWADQPAHHVPAHQLTADHVVPVSAGGDPYGELTARCRSCNARKGASLSS